VGSVVALALPGLKVIGMGLLSAVAAASVQYMQGVDYGSVFGPAVGGLVTIGAHLLPSPFKR